MLLLVSFRKATPGFAKLSYQAYIIFETVEYCLESFPTRQLRIVIGHPSRLRGTQALSSIDLIAKIPYRSRCFAGLMEASLIDANNSII